MKTFLTILIAVLGTCAFAQVPPPPAASQSEVNAGTVGTKFVSPKTLAAWTGSGAAITNLPSTIHLLRGDGSGGAVDSGINASTVLTNNSTLSVNLTNSGNILGGSLISGGFSTNVLQSWHYGFMQGIANNGGTNFIALTAVIYAQNVNSNHNLYVNIAPFPPGSGMDHLGSPFSYNGLIYCPAEYYNSEVSSNASVAIFNANDLTTNRFISVSNYQSEISAVAVMPNFSNTPTLFASDFVHGNLFQYSLVNNTNLTFIRQITTTSNLTGVQGLSVRGDGYLYATLDIADTAGISGYVIKIDPTNGVSTLVGNLPWSGEIEGPCFINGHLAIPDGTDGTLRWINIGGETNLSSGGVLNNGLLDLSFPGNPETIGVKNLPISAPGAYGVSQPDGVFLASTLGIFTVTSAVNTNNASQLTSGTVDPSRLPVASGATKGVVSADGTTIANTAGVLSVIGGGAGISATNTPSVVWGQHSFWPTNANFVSGEIGSPGTTNVLSFQTVTNTSTTLWITNTLPWTAYYAGSGTNVSYVAIPPNSVEHSQFSFDGATHYIQYDGLRSLDMGAGTNYQATNLVARAAINTNAWAGPVMDGTSLNNFFATNASFTVSAWTGLGNYNEPGFCISNNNGSAAITVTFSAAHLGLNSTNQIPAGQELQGAASIWNGVRTNIYTTISP